ncbi:MAG: hypothetical protein CME59_20825 [Halioglobus sp.]|nr:hypothetical protein [Halioglobus sp.]|tara:strand:- start:3735 stop:4001 length:267 start_codon:yes stop_codon:yes gene_type:complete
MLQHASHKHAAGKLKHAIRRELEDELGKEAVHELHEVLRRCQELVEADSPLELRSVLGDLNVAEHLGLEWVESHPAVLPYIEELESLL